MRIAIFGKVMRSNWRLGLALALIAGLAAGVIITNGSGRVRAQAVEQQLELDFATVDWDQASPGATKVIAGDLIFESGGLSQSPTIRNNSDHGVSIALVFSPLLQDSFPPKTTDKFGACFGKSPSTIQCIGLSDQVDVSGIPIDAVSALETVQFDSDPARVLCPGELGKLDLHVHPRIGIVHGVFSGSVEVTASPASGVCADDQGTATGVDVLNLPAVVVIAATGSEAPVIQCAWQFPDMQSGFSDGTTPDPSFQYGTSASGHLHDDHMPLGPSINPACSGPPGSLPSQVDGVTNMIQFAANAGDTLEERWVQLWVTLEHPLGIQNVGGVFWRVFDSDGFIVTQVHGTKIGDSDAVKESPGAFPGGASQPRFDLDNDAFFGTVGLSAYERRISECGQLGQSTSAGSMFEAGAHIGELSGAAVDDINLGIVARCMGNVTAVFYAKFSISSVDPCGEYKVEVHATGLLGNPPVLLNSFIDVICPDLPELSIDKVWLGIDPANAPTVTVNVIGPGGFAGSCDSLSVAGCHFEDIEPGSYTITETTLPLGYSVVSWFPDSDTDPTNGTLVDLTFDDMLTVTVTNQLDLSDTLADVGIDSKVVPPEVLDALVVADQLNVLQVIPPNTTDIGNLVLEPDGVVVIGTGSTISGNIEGDAGNTVVIGGDTFVNGNIDGVGILFVAGSNVVINGNLIDNMPNEIFVGPGAQVQYIGNVLVANIEIDEGGSLTIDGNLALGSSMVLSLNSSLNIGGNMTCNAGATADVDPTATVSIGGNPDCPVL